MASAFCISSAEKRSEGGRFLWTKCYSCVSNPKPLFYTEHHTYLFIAVLILNFLSVVSGWHFSWDFSHHLQRSGWILEPHLREAPAAMWQMCSEELKKNTTKPNNQKKKLSTRQYVLTACEDLSVRLLCFLGSIVQNHYTAEGKAVLVSSSARPEWVAVLDQG